MDWKTIENIIESFEIKEKEEKEDCIHDTTDINGYMTCIMCGVVLYQLFKKESEDYGFVEEKKTVKTKYSQINEIRKKFIDYTVKSQNKLSTADYIKFATAWNEKKFTEVNKKNVVGVLKECNLDISDATKYLCCMKHNKIYSHSFNNNNIAFVLETCIKFIRYYKNIIKNINKRCLIFVICKQKNMYLYDYLGFMRQVIVDRYDELYFSFRTSDIIYWLESNNFTSQNF